MISITSVKRYEPWECTTARALNALLLQWFFVRIFVTVRRPDKKVLAIGIAYPVYPLSGWLGRPYSPTKAAQVVLYRPVLCRHYVTGKASTISLSQYGGCFVHVGCRECHKSMMITVTKGHGLPLDELDNPLTYQSEYWK